MSDSFDKFLEQGEQRSPGWLAGRIGLTTASRVRDVTDKLKSGLPGAKRTAYLWEKVLEKLSGLPAEHFVNAAMARGTELEPKARMAFEARTGEIVTEVGLIHHPTIADFAGSPDGFIGDSGGLEIKVPWVSAHHLQCFLSGMPAEHEAQIYSLMACTGRAYWTFASFDDRLPAPLDLYTQRIERDDKIIAGIESEVLVFNKEISAMVEKLKAIR
jgi:hypothetical protein